MTSVRVFPESIAILLVTAAEGEGVLIGRALAEWSRQVVLKVVYTLAEANAELALYSVDLVIADMQLPDGSGVMLLPPAWEKRTFPLIMLADQGKEQEAMAAMRAGALDCLVRSPVFLAELPRTVERSLREWRNIVGRRQAEAALRESERKYRLLFENMTAGFALHEMIYDETGAPVDYRYLEANPAFERLTGIPVDTIAGKTVKELLPNIEQSWIDVFAAVARTGKPAAYVDFAEELGRYYDAWAFSPGPDQFAVVFTDVTERVRAEEALLEREERWRSVFTTAAAGMVLIDPEGRMIEANPWLCRLIGYENDELVGRKVEEVTYPDDRPLTAYNYERLFDGDCSSIHYEKRYLCKDGRIVWGHVSVACVLTPEHVLHYCIGLVQDITEQKRVEEELRRKNQELDAFVHTASHDLRTPLTPIIGYAELLQEMFGRQLDEQGRLFLQEIVEQAETMLAMLEDLLAMARMGYLERPDEPVDVGSVVTDIAANLGIQLNEAGMTVSISPLPDVRMPRSLLIQIFDNLLGNAVRYAGRGEIEVSGERTEDRVCFRVRDHGPGIPEEERDKVFDLFYRGSTGEQLIGTGVGLASVQKIARLYGGRAWVENAPDGGCVVLVELADCG